MSSLAILLTLCLQATQSSGEFEDRLKRATGPAQLKQLEAWCAKNKLDS